MKRNKNVDILRAAAILIIIVYHAYALTGYPWANHMRLNRLLSFGGEVGVTLFFVLSGYGIAMSLNYKSQQGNLPSWGAFMKKRCLRIMPQYYFCIVFLLLFQSQAWISGQGLKHILAYGLFGQNLTATTHGSINGALWAMATIFQFYLIALPLFRLVKKNYLAAGLGAILVTIASKYVIYHLILAPAGADGTAYFVYGRQLISALDNFVLGMVAAILSQKLLEGRKERKKGRGWLGLVEVLILLAAIVVTAYWYNGHGLYVDALRGYVGHSLLALLMTGLVVAAAISPEAPGFLTRPGSFLAKYQYGMYLWHMPLIVSLVNGSPAFQKLAAQSFLAFAVSIIVIAGLVGVFLTKCIDGYVSGRAARKMQ